MDLEAAEKCRTQLKRGDALAPQETPLMSGVFNAPIYGMTRWDLLFSSRQLLVAKVLGEEIDSVCRESSFGAGDPRRALALKILLLLVRGKYLDFRSTLCGWISVGEKIGHTFGRQALGMIFDWAEGTAFGDMSGSWERSYEAVAELIRREGSALTGGGGGTALAADAQHHPLPDDSVDAVITDPPYYNAVPYADLSDFFYLWLRPHLINDMPELFSSLTAPKGEELCEMKGWDPIRYPNKDAAFYEAGMRERSRGPEGVPPRRHRGRRLRAQDHGRLGNPSRGSDRCGMGCHRLLADRHGAGGQDEGDEVGRTGIVRPPRMQTQGKSIR